jgi:phospholipase/carboxylesterase
MHICVSDVVAQEIVECGWGEFHPLKDKGVNEVLFYAPRDSGEYELARYALAEAWSHATGKRTRSSENTAESPAAE